MGEEYYKRIFSENLRRYMLINNKTQIDLVNDLGFDKSAVSTWVNGTRLPRMDKVNMLANYFHISRSDLIESFSDRCPAAVDPLLFDVNKSIDQLNDEGLRRLAEYARFLSGSDEYKKKGHGN